MKSLVWSAMVALLALPAQAQLAAPNDVGVAFSHVHLSVKSVEEHGRLWTDLFDARLIEKQGYTAVAVPGALVFLTERDPTEPSARTVIDHFGFQVRDIEAVFAKWRALGNEVDQEFSGPEGEAKAYITMPDGVRLELEENPRLGTPTAMHHVHMYAPGYRALLTWYVDVFGATPRTRGTIETTADVPGANLSFGASESERASSQGTAIDHIGFEVDDMEGFAERLRQRGVDIEPFYVESLEIWVGFFTDASGVRVEVTEGLDNY